MGTPGTAWTRQVGTTSFETARAISADAAGALLVAGSSFVFENANQSRSFDVLLTKFNSDGSLAWAKLDGTPAHDIAHAVTNGNDGEIYVSGQTDGDLHGLNNSGGSDIFLSRYSSDGDWRWSTLLGSSGDDISYSIYRDKDGSIYLAGSSTGNLGGQINQGGSDIFIGKYNSDGQLLWVRLLGSPGDDVALDLASDGSGRLFLAGWLSDEQAPEETRALVAAFSEDGDLIWRQQLYGNSRAKATTIQIGTDGQVVVAGHTHAPLEQTTSQTDANLFVSSLNANNGSQNWITTVGSGEDDQTASLAADASGSLYLAATTKGALADQPNRGYSDVAVIALSSQGDEQWRSQMGSEQADFAADLIVTQQGNLVLTGSTNGSFNGQQHQGTRDIIVHSIQASTSPPPQGIALSQYSISENLEPNSRAALLNISNAELAGEATFTLAEGEGGKDNGNFSIIDNQLIINATADHELQSRFQIRIRATNANGLYIEQPVLIEVIDQNEAPTAILLSTNLLRETSSIGSRVASLQAEDPDRDNNHTFSLISGPGDSDNNFVEITNNQLKLLSAVDFEQQNTLAIRARATDQDGLFFDQALILTIEDINESPTDIQLSQTDFNATLPIRSSIGSFSTVDPDQDDRFTYSLIRGEGATENSFFSINRDTLTLRTPLPENKTTASIRVRTSDQLGNSYERPVLLRINRAPTAINLSTTSFDENLPAGSKIAQLTALDPNTIETFQYELAAGENDLDNDRFFIIDDALYLRFSPDYEKKHSYAIHLRATDLGGLFVEQEFTLNVNDLEEPTKVTASATSFPENISGNSTVATLAISHPDPERRFSLGFASGDGDSDNQSFELVGNQLRVKVSPDHEQQASYDVRLRATDQFGSSSEHELRFQTIDQNEPPSGIAASSYIINLNTEAQSKIASLHAIDPDLNDQFTFTLVNGDGSTDNRLFRLIGNELILAEGIQPFLKTSFSVRVRASDQGNLTKDQALTFRVNSPPTRIQATSQSVQENSPASSFIANLQVIDPDASDEHLLTLIDDDGDNASFEIDGNTLIINEVANYEKKSSYQLRIKATDPYGLSFEQPLEIRVVNELEAPQLLVSAKVFNETLLPGDRIAELSVSDIASEDQPIYTLVSGNGSDDNAFFLIDGDQIKLREAVSHITARNYQLRIRATLNSGEFIDEAITLTINRKPEDVRISSTTFNAATPAGTVVASLNTIDPDLEDQFSYMLVVGQASNNAWQQAVSLDNQYFSIDENKLVVNDEIINHDRTFYTIRIRATDQGGLYIDKDLKLERIPAPTRILSSSYHIPESMLEETLVAALFTDTAYPNELPVISLVDGESESDNARFRIQDNQLILLGQADHEKKNQYDIRIQALFSDGYRLEQPLSFNVEDDNESPVSIVLSSDTFDESFAGNSTVALLNAIDPDADDSHTFSLAVGFDNESNNDLFTIDGNELKLQRSIDYEQQSKLSLLIRVTDSGGLFHEQQITLNVHDVNEGPQRVLLSTDWVQENIPAKSIIGSLSTDDPDLDEAITYTLTASAVGDDNEAFTVDANQLIINESPDFESKPSYKIRLRATDKAGLFTETDIQLNVRNANERPQDIHLSASLIPYEFRSGSTVAVLTSSDPDSNEAFKYDLNDNDASLRDLFSIRGDKLIANRDAEALVQSAYPIRIRSTDQAGLSVSKDFTIAVEEAPTVIQSSATTIGETTAINTPVAALSLQGPKAKQIQTYTITNSASPDELSYFSIEGNQLILKQSVDFETINSLSLNVRASGEDGIIADQVLTFSILDENEAPTELSLSNSRISESSSPRSLVATLSATDPDTSDTHVFSLPSSGGPDNHLFYIQRNQLRTKTRLDYEKQSIYQIRIRATDQAGLSLERDITITLEDANEPPQGVRLSSRTIPENSVLGSVVGVLQAQDPDLDDRFAYELVPGFGSYDNGNFAIENNQLLTTTPLDYESQNTYTIRVRATDRDGLSIEQEIELEVTDVNEAPFNIRSSTDEIISNTLLGQAVAVLNADDSDLNDTLTFQLISGDGDSGNTFFELQDNILRLAKPLPFNDQSSLSIRVRVSDKAGHAIDQILSFALPKAIIVSDSSFPESSAIGSTLSQLSISGTASDSEFTFALSSNSDFNDNNSFLVVGDKLILNSHLDYESKRLYVAGLSAKSNSTELAIQRTVLLDVKDVNEAPTRIYLSQDSVEETALADDIIANISGLDPDAGQSLSFSITSVNGEKENLAFSVSENHLVLNKAVQELEDRLFTIRLRATDAEGLFVEEDFNLPVVAALQLSNQIISEGILPGTSIGRLSTSSSMVSSEKYMLVEGPEGNGNSLFFIDGDQLRIGFIPDHEERQSYAIRVAALNGNDNLITKSFIMTVADDNEAPTSLSLSTNKVEENLPENATVAEINALDPDANDTITYSLASGSDSDDNSLFLIKNNHLILKKSANHEDTPFYKVRIKATDSAGLSAESSFLIEVLNNNDSPSGIAASTAHINAHAPARSVVATLTTTDDDVFDRHIYTLVSGAGSDDNQMFSILGNKLRLVADLASAPKQDYSLRLRSTDLEGSFVEQVLKLTLNQQPQELTLSFISLDESQSVDMPIADFIVDDPDQLDVFTYSFTPGQGARDNDKFVIIGSQLFCRYPIDYEERSSYSIRIRATDQGGLSLVRTFILDVNDINEAPSDFTISTNILQENMAQGSVVATFDAIDPEKAGEVTFTLPLEKDNKNFSIDGNKLLVNSLIDYEERRSYELNIRATDVDGFSSDNIITLNVTNVKESVASSVSLALPSMLDTLVLSGNADINAFGNAADNELIGNQGDNRITGGGGKDILTGMSGSDKFVYPQLTDSLINSFDHITDLAIGIDYIDAPAPVAAGAIENRGIFPGLSSPILQEHLDSSRLDAYAACLFSTVDPFPLLLRTFMVINDGEPGFAPDKDAVIEITGYRGNLNELTIT